MIIRLNVEEIVEEVEAREVSAGTFELLETPLFFSDELGLGDVVLLDRDEDGSYRLREIMERPFRHFFRVIPGEYGHSKAIYDFGDWVIAHGGRWETAMGGLLFLHFPRGCKMPRVKAELRTRLERFAQSEERTELIKAGPSAHFPKRDK